MRTELNPLDSFLLSRIGKEIESKYEIQRIVSSFLDNTGVFDEPGLTAMLMLYSFRDKLPDDFRVGLGKVIDESELDSAIMKRLKSRMQSLDSEVNLYFKAGVYPYSWYAPTPLNHDLADAILKLRCLSIESEYQDKFEREDKIDWIIEYFSFPEKEKWGIWMSTTGIHFDPERIK